MPVRIVSFGSDAVRIARAIRPAFDAESRPQLIKQVTTGTPLKLCHLDPRIPVDLQNVIHKSIERDPSRRYENAAASADDLQRFLEDRPIRARPISAAERNSAGADATPPQRFWRRSWQFFP